MIVVLASRLDPDARSLIQDWSGADVALLSAEDLVTSGWEFSPADPAGGMAVVAGSRVRVAEIHAVLTRRPSVLPEELGLIDPADRSYISAEVNAFLVAWLSSFPRRVVNRPTPTSLCGPLWDGLHWQVVVARLGAEWQASADAALARHVVVCGERCLFAENSSQSAIARALARLACVDLLEVGFIGDKVCSVSVAPSLGNADVRESLLHHLIGRP